jgi:hypothetical protein
MEQEIRTNRRLTQSEHTLEQWLAQVTGRVALADRGPSIIWLTNLESGPITGVKISRPQDDVQVHLDLSRGEDLTHFCGRLATVLQANVRTASGGLTLAELRDADKTYGKLMRERENLLDLYLERDPPVVPTLVLPQKRLRHVDVE